jgi:hypothetical protein
MPPHTILVLVLNKLLKQPPYPPYAQSPFIFTHLDAIFSPQHNILREKWTYFVMAILCATKWRLHEATTPTQQDSKAWPCVHKSSTLPQSQLVKQRWWVMLWLCKTGCDCTIFDMKFHVLAYNPLCFYSPAQEVNWPCTKRINHKMHV